MDAAVVLINPKTPYNVGAAIRACAIFEVPTLRWTGKRITEWEAARKAGGAVTKRKSRLPREERMKDYAQVDWTVIDGDVITQFDLLGYAPVAVEIRPGAERLQDFVHPERAVYVFGPEDGSLGKGVLTACHRFVQIDTPNRTPFNLAAAVNVVLYDRLMKEEMCQRTSGLGGLAVLTSPR